MVTNNTGVPLQLVQCTREDRGFFGARRRDSMDAAASRAPQLADRSQSSIGSFLEGFGSGRRGSQLSASVSAGSQQHEGTAAGPEGCPLVDWTTRLPLPAGERLAGCRSTRFQLAQYPVEANIDLFRNS